jgi:cation diffusion facilitator family transporter
LHGGAGDANFRAAMLHVVADALTSVLAIVALAGGLWQGWRWLDPAVALVAALVIGRWALGVLHQATRALVDATADAALRREVRERIESDGDAKLADLHVWQVGPGAWSAALSLVADRPLQPAAYRLRLQPVASLRHVTVEVNRCFGADRGPLSSRSSEELS